MLYPEDFFENLPKDVIKALKVIIDYYFANIGPVNSFDELTYDKHIDAFAALEAFIQSSDLESVFKIPELGSGKSNNIEITQKFFTDSREVLELKLNGSSLEAYRYKYKLILSKGFTYKFADADLIRIKDIFNEMHLLMTKNELFNDNYKFRLINKFESLEDGFHKKMTNLDSFWGLLGEAGVLNGKYGKDAKPFVDRMKELTDIAWRAQASAEELPSNSPIPYHSNHLTAVLK